MRRLPHDVRERFEKAGARAVTRQKTWAHITPCSPRQQILTRFSAKRFGHDHVLLHPRGLVVRVAAGDAANKRARADGSRPRNVRGAAVSARGPPPRKEGLVRRGWTSVFACRNAQFKQRAPARTFASGDTASDASAAGAGVGIGASPTQLIRPLRTSRCSSKLCVLESCKLNEAFCRKSSYQPTLRKRQDDKFLKTLPFSKWDPIFPSRVFPLPIRSLFDHIRARQTTVSRYITVLRACET